MDDIRETTALEVVISLEDEIHDEKQGLGGACVVHTTEVLSDDDANKVDDAAPVPVNRTMLQGFEWYCPADYRHWRRLRAALPALAEIGITSVWIPPACKPMYRDGTGYDICDLYDLGEFDQKGAVQTKHGTRRELEQLVQAANGRGIGIIFDAVMNHKAGADYTEEVQAVRVDPMNRLKEISRTESIVAWTGFDHAVREGRYSDFTWNKSHFSGVDYDDRSKKTAIWKFNGKKWATDADPERGSYDYLMFANVDHANPEVREEFVRWAEWLGAQLRIGGIRLDAIKHISMEFIRYFVEQVSRSAAGRDYCFVGEYWSPDVADLLRYLEYMRDSISLFDIPLAHNFSSLSFSKCPDLRTVFKGTLVSVKPDNSVSFVMNHDTQEGQASELLVAPWFIPLAYALILLRTDSGVPCLFYGDLYGSFGPRGKRPPGTFEPPSAGQRLVPRMALARRLYAYGPQEEYLERADCVGFTRHGHPSRSEGAGLAVVMTSGPAPAEKRMRVGRRHAGERWTDILRPAGSRGEVVRIGSRGWATFPVGPRGVAVYVDAAAVERDLLDCLVFDHNIYRF